MAQYTIEINYRVTTTQVVEARDEGEALDKARDLADETDLSDMLIAEELESKVVNVSN